jgi:hypothetical protein
MFRAILRKIIKKLSKNCKKLYWMTVAETGVQRALFVKKKKKKSNLKIL